MELGLRPCHPHHEPGECQHHNCADGGGPGGIRFSDSAFSQDGSDSGKERGAKGIEKPHDFTPIGSEFADVSVPMGTGKVWHEMRRICIPDIRFIFRGHMRIAKGEIPRQTHWSTIRNSGRSRKVSDFSRFGCQGTTLRQTGQISRWDRPSRGGPAGHPAGCLPGCRTWPGRRGRFCPRSGSWTGRGKPARPQGR